MKKTSAKPHPDTNTDLVEIYTDGSCLGNPGPGGWAALLSYKDHQREISGHQSHTTNNRMELLAAIEALRALNRPCRVLLHTDSTYLKQGISEWLPKWQKNQWKTSNKKAVRNQELWQDLSLLNARHQVQWRWVKAHAGHQENERVDDLARASAQQAKDLAADIYAEGGAGAES